MGSAKENLANSDQVSEISEIMHSGNIVQKVTEGGVCIGCGACAYLSDKVTMDFDKYGKIIPLIVKNEKFSNKEEQDITSICPFSGEGRNEDELAKNLFSSLPKDNEIGHYHKIFAGRVKESKWFENGSSGGLGKWLLHKLLESNLVDHVIQVAEADPFKDDQGKLYKYKVLSRKEDVIRGSKSVYYPIELSDALHYIEQNPGRYAITGVPCFIKTIRRLAEVNPVFKERIKFTLGIVCGHLKSKGYAELIAWQLGIEPRDLTKIDFRKKLPGKKANEKGVVATSQSGNVSQPEIVQNIFGTNYGQGFFKYEACDYCDDIVGETADISIGDAWLPQFMDQGSSLVITRNKTLSDIIVGSMDQNELELTALSPKQAADSQRAGIRHRRDYLQYRLFLKQSNNQWYPQKRVSPKAEHLSQNLKKIVEVRSKLATDSHREFLIAKEKDNLQYFKNAMKYHTELLHDLARKGMRFFAARLLRTLRIYDLLAKISKH